MTFFRTAIRREDANGELICQIGESLGAAGHYVVELRTNAVESALAELASRNLLNAGLVAVTEEVEEAGDR